MTVPVTLSDTPILQFFNNIGAMNAGGSLLTQVGGINHATYQDSAGTIPLPNPIPLNSRGEISNSSGVSCQLYLEQGVNYTLTLYDIGGNQINQASVMEPSPPVLTASEWVLFAGLPTYINSTKFTVIGNQTSIFQSGRKIQASVTAGTVYGYVASQSFSSGATTVVLVMNSGQSLDSGLSSVSYSFLEADNNSVVPATYDFFINMIGSPYKVVMDGTTDNTAGIQAAINSNRAIILEEGIARANSSLNITHGNFRMFGNGSASILQLESVGNGISLSGSIDQIQIEEMQIRSSSATNNLIYAVGVNDMFHLNKVYFNGGGNQVFLSSNVNSAGTYGAHISQCEFYAAGLVGLRIAPQSIAFSQAHSVIGCEFFGCMKSIFGTSGSGWFFDHCRFERIATLVGAGTTIHFDNCSKMAMRDCYIEENNPVKVIEIGGNTIGAIFDGLYMSLNNNGGASALQPFFVVSGSNVDLITFINSDITWAGTLGTILDFQDCTRATAKRNRLNGGIATNGISSSANSLLTDFDETEVQGTITNVYANNAYKKDQRFASVLAKYNGAASSLAAGSLNISGVVKIGTGDYTLNFTNAFNNTDFICIHNCPAVSNGSLICSSTEVIADRTTSSVHIRIAPTGGGTGGLADTSQLTLMCMGSVTGW